MTVNHIMKTGVITCDKDTSLQEVAKLMVDNDCGSLPVIDAAAGDRVVGIITDRDIVVRSLARGESPLALTAFDCMTGKVETVGEATEIAQAMKLMEHHQVRRVPVIDADGKCVGIIAQADLATECEPVAVAKTISEISRPAVTV